MLRHQLGEQAFWDGVQKYLETYANRLVETDDFRHVMEQVSGKSLGRFFDQWFRTPGHPRLRVWFRWDQRSKKGIFEIEQLQVDVKKGVPLFDFPLELGWRHDASLETRTVQVKEKKSVFAFDMKEDPTQVRVDPFGNLVHELEFDPGETRLRRQLEAGDIRGRIQAGLGLAKKGPSAVAALTAAFREESYWGVQVEWAEALGGSRTEAALESLLALTADHEESRSLYALFEALAKYRDPRVVDVVRERIRRGLAPKALGAAWRALGAQREAAPLEAIVEGAKTRGWAGMAQSDAFKALAETRREEALAPLLDGAKTADPRSRGVAAECAGKLAKRLEGRTKERAAEALEDLLRADDGRQRSGAAKGLVAAESRASLGALEAYGATLTHQEKVLLERTLGALRRPSTPRQLEKELEKMREKLRKLEHELRHLQARQD